MPKCRFCSNLIPNDMGEAFCLEKEKVLSETFTKRKIECESYRSTKDLEENADFYGEIPFKEDRNYTKPNKKYKVTFQSHEDIMFNTNHSFIFFKKGK